MSRSRFSPTNFFLFGRFALTILLTVGSSGVQAQNDRFPEEALNTILEIERFGRGNAAAPPAWKKLAVLPPSQLPRLLAAFDRSNPISANWLRTAGEAIVVRAHQGQDPIPVEALADFVLDDRHAASGRQFAYELLLKETPEAKAELAEALLNDPSGVLRRDPVGQLLVEGERLLENGEKDRAIAVYRRALNHAVDYDQLTTIIERLEKLNVALDVPNEYGFILHWKVIGPFDNTGEEGFHVVYPPEKEMEAKRLSQEQTPSKSYEGKEGNVAWKDHRSDDRLGLVDFNKIYGKQKNVCAYALADIHSEKRQSVTLRFSSFNALKIWHDGRLVREIDVYHGGQKADQYIVPVEFREGSNSILVKVCQNDQPQSWAENWGFSMRVCDRAGRPLRSDNE